MLYRDKTGNLININICDFKNDHIYYNKITNLKRYIYKNFNNTIENVPKDNTQNLKSKI